MARSKWFETLIVALASTRLALCQPAEVPQAAQAAKPAERIITVNEGDKGPQKCRVLKTWQMADGTMAMQVEAIATGEIMTIVEEGSGSAPATPGSRARTMTTRIFHWGSNRTSPPGVPTPPQTEIVHSRTVSPPLTGLAVSKSMPPTSTPTTSTNAPASTAATTTKTMPSTTAPTTPTTPTPTPSRVGSSYSPTPVMAQRLASPPPVIVEKKETTERGLLGRMFQRSEPRPMIMTQPEPKPLPPKIASAPPVKSIVEVAQPSDYRQSWGNPEASKAQTTKTDPPKSTPAKTVSHTSKSDPPRSLPDLPRANSSPTDPLKEPASYVRTPVEKSIKPPANLTKSEITSPTQTPEGPSVPLGTGSVLAAGDVKFLPVPVVTVPNVNRMPITPPNVQVPQAPQPNQNVLSNAFSNPMANPASTAPQPGEMANAFSPATPIDGSATGGASAFSGPVAAPGSMMAQGMMPPNPYAMMARGMNPGVGASPMMMNQMAMAPRNMMQPGLSQASYHPPMQPTHAIAPDVQQMLVTLRDAMYPSHREVAAEKLGALRAQSHPQVVEALLIALKADPAPSVRATCVRSLGKMKAVSPAVIAALQALKADPEASVRHEAEQALLSLAPAGSAGTVQPTGGTLPLKP